MIQLAGFTRDSITGLPIFDDFQKNFFVIAEKLRYPVVVSINIKNFKYFNQIYGFQNGDILLKRLSEHFCYQNPDCCLGARSHSDHLVVLLEAYTPDELTIQEELGIICREFVRVQNREFPLARIHIKCGAYFLKKEDKELDAVLDRIRYARKEVDANYRNNVMFYTEELEQRILSEARVIPMFEQALEENRILLYLQPKFSIDEQKLTGAEALARIRDADGTILSPASFVPVLEESGLITYLDRCIIHLLVDAMKGWMDSEIPLFTVSVNLSRLDFFEEGFLEEVVQYVYDAGVPQRYIEFELTETVFCEQMEEVVSQIRWLREQGFRISMDDFGSGYNSLDVIGLVPADVVKFDRSFVLHSLKTEMGKEVMRNLVNMFQKIDFEVLCEGVETKDEEQLVYECGCNQIQGYLHDKPLDVKVFTEKYLK